jgi:molybdopterin synthase catalytic subunit
MAEEEIARVAAEAEARWPLSGVTIIHRYGSIAPGSRIVLVVTASAHRGAAFDAAEFLMDYLKTRAPFWKRARRADGALEDWVEPKSSDDDAAERWRAGGAFRCAR